MSDIPDIDAQISELGSVAFRIADERNKARAIASELLAALRELSHVSRSYIAHMDADDIVALNVARAAIVRAEVAGVK